MSWEIALAGLLIGFLVGLTGMGGGALTTPVLIFFFNVRPVFAVGTDLVFAAVTKMFGAYAHHRQGTVNHRLVRQLALGSVPAALAGIFVIRALGVRADTDTLVTRMLGATIILVAVSLIVDALLLRGRGGWLPGMRMPTDRPWLNVLIGAVVGFLLALTSVGSGTLILAALITAYPGVVAAELVGTDVFHAAILVAVAGIGHLSLGTVDFSVVGSLLVGSVPGVMLGSRMAIRAPDGLLRPLLAGILLLSGVKLV